MRVAIDPGHGMSNRNHGIYDPGATHVENGTEFREADINLRYALSLKDILRAQNIEVFMTRDDAQDDAPVGQRAKNAENAGCDALISIHVNDFDTDSANGVEVIYSRDEAFANDMQKALVNSTKLRDRGSVKRSDLAVLRFDGPAVLLELGFIANDKDRECILNPQVRDSVCREVADVIRNKLGGRENRSYAADAVRTADVVRTAEVLAPQGLSLIDQIIAEAAKSAVARYRWPDRGRAPIGYVKGMALAFGRVYCKLLQNDSAAKAMAKTRLGDTDHDALARYEKKFAEASLPVANTETDTLRNLFTLLIGLGMRESSGKYCEGRDRSVRHPEADTAEAGLFQTSYNAHHCDPLMSDIFQGYSMSPHGFLEVFQEGVPSDACDPEIVGTGDGATFQRLSKTCPAFAVEFAALGLRNITKHWGPLVRHEAKVRPECDQLLRAVQTIVDACPDAASHLL